MANLERIRANVVLCESPEPTVTFDFYQGHPVWLSLARARTKIQALAVNHIIVRVVRVDDVGVAVGEISKGLVSFTNALIPEGDVDSDYPNRELQVDIVIMDSVLLPVTKSLESMLAMLAYASWRPLAWGVWKWCDYPGEK
ncbi:hypothetical protein GGF32_005486 [Allomyces javanicus]|nr:hypothetical protein GGF32_005486 [Allomyces javanicus]